MCCRAAAFCSGFVLLVGLLLIGAVAPAWAKPERIVSMNLCTDQLVMMLADRHRIASVSYLAANPQASALADETDGLTLNHGLAEEILPMEPDLVLAGSFTTRPTVALLRRFGFSIVELPVASSLDDIRANIRTIAEAIGEVSRGEAMIAEFDRTLQQLPAAETLPPPLAVMYWANGFTSGKGTLANAAVEAAGFRTLGTALELTGTAQLPLETLLNADPDVLIVGRQREDPALANEVFRHPALGRVFDDRPMISLPDYLWICGTPFVVEAVARLADLRASLQQGGGEPAATWQPQR